MRPRHKNGLGELQTAAGLRRGPRLCGQACGCGAWSCLGLLRGQGWGGGPRPHGAGGRALSGGTRVM